MPEIDIASPEFKARQDGLLAAIYDEMGGVIKMRDYVDAAYQILKVGIATPPKRFTKRCPTAQIWTDSVMDFLEALGEHYGQQLADIERPINIAIWKRQKEIGAKKSKAAVRRLPVSGATFWFTFICYVILNIGVLIWLVLKSGFEFWMLSIPFVMLFFVATPLGIVYGVLVNLGPFFVGFLKRCFRYLVHKKDTSQEDLGMPTELRCLTDLIQSVPGLRLANQRYMFARSKDGVRHKIKTLSPLAFEKYSADIFKKFGFETQLTRRTGDGGVDVLLRHEGRVMAAQCKKHKTPIGTPVLRDFFGALKIHGFIRGYVIATSGFSFEAINLLSRLDNRVFVLDFDTLVELDMTAGGDLSPGLLDEIILKQFVRIKARANYSEERQKSYRP